MIIHREHLLVVSKSFGLTVTEHRVVQFNGMGNWASWPKPYLVILISFVYSCEGTAEHLDQEGSNAGSG